MKRERGRPIGGLRASGWHIHQILLPDGFMRLVRIQALREGRNPSEVISTALHTYMKAAGAK